MTRNANSLGDSSEAVISLSDNGEVQEWSESASTILGYTPEEAEGFQLAELLYWSDARPELDAQLGQVHSHSTHHFDIPFRHKDGSLIFVSVAANITEQDNVRSVILSMKDITQARSCQDADLIADRYGELLETTPDGIVVVNASGRIVFVNTQAREMFLYGEDRLVGQPVEVLLEHSLRSQHIQHRTQYVKQPRVRPMGAGMELNGLRKDGSTFPVEISLSSFQTDAGIMYMSAIRDISERKKAETKFRGLLESAPDAMVISDLQGDIYLVNSQAEKLFGYSRKELLGNKIEMLIPQRYRHNHPQYRDQYFKDPNFRPMGIGLELYGIRKDQTEFPVEISLSPLETEEGLLVSAAIRDITERKIFEQELKQKNIQLVNANKAKDHFLASMSHELRTPLNAIIGFTGTLLMELPGPVNEDQSKQLHTIQSSSKHLLSLINDLLDLAKIEAGKMEMTLDTIDCGEVVYDVCTMLRPKAAEKGLEFLMELPDSELPLQSDRRALMQILSNLISNAIKFTEAGEVRVSVTRCHRKEKNCLLFTVSDTGIGIDPEQQASLFTPFSQVHDKSKYQVEGTGLGIYLSQKLASMLGGKISCESEPGVGSSFTLELDSVEL